jgi:hypothetical protein
MKLQRKIKLANLNEEFELARMAVHGQIIRDCLEYKAEITGENLYEFAGPWLGET